MFTQTTRKRLLKLKWTVTRGCGDHERFVGDKQEGIRFSFQCRLERERSKLMELSKLVILDKANVFSTTQISNAKLSTELQGPNIIRLKCFPLQNCTAVYLLNQGTDPSGFQRVEVGK